MTEEAKKARREYLRKWRAANPDKVAAAQERFWMKKAAAMKMETADDPRLVKCETREAAPADP